MTQIKNSSNFSAVSSAPEHEISPWLTLLLACACGLIAANIYYAQPLVGPISQELRLSEQSSGLIVTLTQIGYGAGLLLVVPLADLFENRRLAITILAIGAAGLLAAGLVTSTTPFLAAALLVGLGSVTVQILVPYAAHLSPEATRGQVVGNVMSGLMLGIMLARPVASLITHFATWRTVFLVSFVAMLALMLTLHLALPKRTVTAKIGYQQMLMSMLQLVRATPTLRRRALYHACMFGAFSLFWTTTPLLLASPTFGLSQKGIALFALAGVAGAIAAPIAGRIADRGWTRPATALAMIMAIAAFAMTHISTQGTSLSLALFVVAGIVLDFAVSANLVLGQRIIFSLAPEIRGRLNGLYMSTFFCGGAIGSALGGWSFAHYGWLGTSVVGTAFGLIALAYFLTEPSS
ncbi:MULTISPECIES: MFS transporter [unclassified Halomonas]|uniref:MFS transporter n=1 Tax=unclassified Halomonas TaxID=2609666 RepID=UPI000482E9B5|nr:MULTISPECIES: MFS transporter [unclassified Halomonas]NAO94446.1 MFS transporter [Halomonas sp. MG34]PKH61843.1 MFS transporter [Halomonas sp. Choline-3u-9]QGQ71539.1 MFS transporter [Halomonas sp. PA16-9]